MDFCTTRGFKVRWVSYLVVTSVQNNYTLYMDMNVSAGTYNTTSVINNSLPLSQLEYNEVENTYHDGG